LSLRPYGFQLSCKGWPNLDPELSGVQGNPAKGGLSSVCRGIMGLFANISNRMFT
jgi:hypothetical protein